MAYTLDPFDDSLELGSVRPLTPGLPNSATWDVSSNQVFVGDWSGNAITVFNGSTGLPTARLVTPASVPGDFSDPGPFAVDASAQLLFAATGFGVSVINTHSDQVVRNISLPSPPSALVLDPSNGRLLSTDGSIRVLNVTSGEIVGTISACGGAAYRAMFDPASSSIYVGCLGPSRVEILSASGLDPIGNLTLQTSDYPTALEYDSWNRQVYISDDDGNVTVVNGSSNQLAAPVSRISVPVSASGLAIDDSNGGVYVQGTGSNIAILDPSNDTVESLQLPAGPTPNGATVDEADHRLYVSDEGLPALTIDDLQTFRLVRTEWLSASYFSGAFDPVNDLLYIADADSLDSTYPGSVVVERPGPPSRVIANITVGGSCPERLAIDADANRIFVSDFCNDSITVINGTTNQVMGPDISVGPGPMGVAFDNRTGLVYVACGLGKSVWVINSTTLRVTAAGIATGSNPDSVAIDPRTDTIWVANYGSDNLSSINGSTLRSEGISLPAGSAPSDLLFDVQNQNLYCADAGSIDILDPGRLSSVGNISITGSPVALAVAANQDVLFAASSGSGSIWVVNTSNQSVAEPPIPMYAGADPQGLVYVPTSSQLDILDGPGAIEIVANSPVILSWTSPKLVDDNLTVSLVATVTGGANPLTFSYSGFPVGCPSVNSSQFRCAFNKPGNVTVGLLVIDAVGYPAWEDQSITIRPYPELLAVDATPSNFDVGLGTQISVNFSGGSGDAQVSYWGLPAGCLSSDSFSFWCTPSSAGRFTIDATVRDSVGGVASGIDTLVVNPAPTAEVEVNPGPSEILGSTLRISINITGGTAPYRFSTEFAPPGCPASNLSAYLCTPNSTGNFSIGGHISDADGESAPFFTSVTIVPTVPPFGLTDFLANPTPVGVGELLDLSATVQNGSAPISWKLSGLPPGCKLEQALPASCRPEQPGTYHIQVMATDSQGRSANASVDAVVIAAASAPLSTPIVVLIVGLGTATLVGVVSIIAIRRRRRRIQTSPF